MSSRLIKYLNLINFAFGNVNGIQNYLYVAITEQASGCTQSIVNRPIDFLIVDQGVGGSLTCIVGLAQCVTLEITFVAL